MTSHVMLSNGLAYVLDCGMGVTNQFVRTGIPFSALKSIFITHYHADHNIEYGPLLIVGWIQGQSGCRLRKSGHQKMSANNPKQYYVHLPEHVQIGGLGIDSASVA